MNNAMNDAKNGPMNGATEDAMNGAMNDAMNLSTQAGQAHPPVADLLPHSGQMVLLDSVFSVDDDNLCAEVRIRPDSMFCDGTAVGAWVGIEYMAQAIAAHAGWLARRRGDGVKVGFLLGSRKYEASVPAFAVDSVLHVHVHRALQGDNGLGAFECRIDHGTDTLATATVTVYQPDNVNEFLKGGTAV
jgi:3-oxoacyl-[acyl-carrier-protein] synthase-1